MQMKCKLSEAYYQQNIALDWSLMKMYYIRAFSYPLSFVETTLTT